MTMATPIPEPRYLSNKSGNSKKVPIAQMGEPPEKEITVTEDYIRERKWKVKKWPCMVNSNGSGGTSSDSRKRYNPSCC